MSKARTATSILEARGAFKKDPNRKRVEPVCRSEFPESAPSHLTPMQVKWWHKVKQAVPAGVLQGSDVFAVELAAVLWTEFVTCSADMPAGRISQMRAVFGTLGLSPSDRAKLAAAPEDDDGGF